MLRLRNLIASLTIDFFILEGATAQANDRSSVGKNPLTEDFASFVTETLDKWKVPGLSVAVVDGDQVFAEGYGFARLPDEPATPETLWYAASTTKAQTAATLARLINSGDHPALANGWSTTISSIIHDDFVLQDAWATEHITLDDAVSHRTGMAAHDKSYARVVEGKEANPKDVVRNLRNLPLTTEPRLKYSYTNSMYTTLSHVIETVTGKWLGDVMKELIWAPLDMNSTFFDLQDANDAPHQLASGYYWDEKEGKYGEVPFMSVTELSGAGAVISNVLDYAKWVKCLLHEAPPFSKEVHKDIKSPRMLESTQPDVPNDIVTYALGWRRTLFKGHVMYIHSGGLHAYGAQVYWLPEIKYGVVAFANTATTSNAAEEVLAWKLIQDRLGIPDNERFDFGAKYRKFWNWLSSAADEAVDILYPERPNPPLPATVNTTKLQGIYYDPGYGRITLHEASHPDRSDEKILVADRQEMTWKYQMNLHHVSGDYWIIYLPFLENPGYFTEFVAGEFKIGNDGKPVGLQVDWVNRVTDEVEGKVLFKKVD
ncbi:beta-lactamase/transpeptidase-like protein [Fusarium solani]|uniref:Beta-lactamase/transpeptidase-like protein n=1 Tax=Fusarium solani TaxID=169388 RepID=A0A9P9JYH8_FUSSL|nr:beta-lactamase/transpeptidase-like protein [Fusarium solani]KAH7237881.1 beta-lactamase/transpeptidase-like protein [Fusarium solani]